MSMSRSTNLPRPSISSPVGTFGAVLAQIGGEDHWGDWRPRKHTRRGNPAATCAPGFPERPRRYSRPCTPRRVQENSSGHRPVWHPRHSVRVRVERWTLCPGDLCCRRIELHRQALQPRFLPNQGHRFSALPEWPRDARRGRKIDGASGASMLGETIEELISE